MAHARLVEYFFKIEDMSLLHFGIVGFYFRFAVLDNLLPFKR